MSCFVVNKAILVAGEQAFLCGAELIMPGPFVFCCQLPTFTFCFLITRGEFTDASSFSLRLDVLSTAGCR